MTFRKDASYRLFKVVERLVERTQRTYIRLALGVPIGCVLLAFLCWGGVYLYRNFESKHLARRAAAYLSAGDLRQAMLSAQSARNIKPTPEAARVLAQIAERTKNPTALEWRREAVKLAPNSQSDLVALANCALQFDEMAEAEKVLVTAKKNGETGASHAIAAQIADVKGDQADARREWTRAAEIEPGNKSYTLGLALANLRSNTPALQKAGHASLEELRADKGERLSATRALIEDAILRHASTDRLKELAHDLQNYPESLFSDRLLYLDILRTTNDPKFARILDETEKNASIHPLNLAQLVAWMNNRGMALLALNFTRSLGQEKAGKWPVPIELANSYLRLADWQGLERFAGSGQWPRLDFMRRAFLARALREQKKTEASDREWSASTREVAEDPRELDMLERSVIDWGWKKEAVDLLWQMAKFPERQTEALRTLYKHYADQKDTRDLYRVLAKLAAATPDDLTVRNNLAQVSLLLNVDTQHAEKMAAELYHRQPSNPAFASTYAFALYSRGNAQQAIRIMRSLSPEQLNEPAAGAYLGIFLTAANQRNEAQPYLKRGANAPLLPEERALLDRCLASGGSH